MRWLDSIIKLMDMNLSKFQEIVEDKGAWYASIYGEGNSNPLQYSCLENPMDGGAWWATLHRVAKSWTQLSDFTFTFNEHTGLIFRMDWLDILAVQQTLKSLLQHHSSKTSILQHSTFFMVQLS